MELWEKESTSDYACYINLFPSNQVNSLEFKTFKLRCGNTQKHEMPSTSYRIMGNEWFEAKKWIEAIGHYNKSIRFAINGSENLNLGYANRSACFLYLKKYDKCLADIELAKNANYPQCSMHKLNERKAKCEKEMKGSAEVDKKVKPELNFSPNTKFPGMADILEVQINDEFGKHVVSKADIDVGKIVLLEDAFAFGGDNDHKMFCKTCAKEDTNFIPCPNCADDMFCSANCLESNDLHKKVCGALYNRWNSIIDVETILIAVSAFSNVESLMEFVERALATRDLDSPECESDSQLKYRSFLKLLALSQDINKMRQKIFMKYEQLLDIPYIDQFFHSEKAKRFLMHLIWQHLNILNTNSFGSTDPKTASDYMKKIWICSSLFNHSCVPNTLLLMHGNKMIACIMRPVKKGEQLFIDYFEGKDSETGQRNLNFRCKCSKCVPRWKEDDCLRIQSDENYKFLVRSVVKIEDLLDHKKRSIYKPKLQNLLAKFGRLPWSPEFDFIDAGYKRCCAQELDWDY